MILFSAENLTMAFGGLMAVENFSLKLKEGDLVGLIGPNGAGKTTVFNMITGNLKPLQGRIFFRGGDITGLKPSAITRRGIARTFQNIRLFQDLKVIENVMISYHGRLRSSFMGAVLRTPLYNQEEKEMYEGALALLHQVHLGDLAHVQAGTLSYGQQRRLEIARALATRPKLLLLDEPAAGMNPLETQELIEFILKVKKEFGLTVLLIEHDMQVVMGICQHIKVLDYGATIAEGSAQEIQTDPKVIAAYLGADWGNGEREKTDTETCFRAVALQRAGAETRGHKDTETRRKKKIRRKNIA